MLTRSVEGGSTTTGYRQRGSNIKTNFFITLINVSIIPNR